MLDSSAAVVVPEPLIVTVAREDGRTLVRAAGEIDLLTVGELERPMQAALQAGEAITLDLSEVEFIDSTGLRLLLESRGRAGRPGNGGLRLVLGERDHVRRLLDLTGVLDLFDLH